MRIKKQMEHLLSLLLARNVVHERKAKNRVVRT